MFENNFQKATKEDIVFFEDFLYPLQDEIFKFFQTDRFYLSGGTCLSRFYYHHRYSEDLDFFFDGFLYPKEEFEQAAKWTEHKVVPLDYEGTIIAFANHNLEGTLLLKDDISRDDFNDFVSKLFRKLIAYAKKPQ